MNNLFDDRQKGILQNILDLAERRTLEGAEMFAPCEDENEDADQLELFAKNFASTAHRPTSLDAAKEYAIERMSKKNI